MAIDIKTNTSKSNVNYLPSYFFLLSGNFFLVAGSILLDPDLSFCVTTSTMLNYMLTN